MSNHWHALMTVESAAQLASFMGFVNGNIARKIGRLHEWRDRFWAGRYSAIVVADNEAAIDRFRYILRNGCKEGLVDSPADWPGVSCARSLTSGEPLQGVWIDQTAEHNAGAGRNADGRPFAKSYDVHLKKLPCWEHLSRAQYRDICRDLIEQIEEETRAERRSTGRKCSGARKVLNQLPHQMPLKSASSPAPRVHAFCAEARAAFVDAFAAFVDAFRFAAARLRAGKRAEFPFGSFPPSGPFVAAPAPA